MAQKQNTTDQVSDATSTPATPDAMGQLAQAIASAVRDLQPPRVIPIGEFVARSPFNPTGKRNRSLPFQLYQNNVRVQPDILHDEELALAPKLRPGLFVSGLVTVTEKELGGGMKAVHINYKNGTADQRMAFKGEVRNFTELLKRCVSEAEAR